jgi:hypothetical protein
VRQRTQTVNAIRAHLSEFGILVAKGIHNLDRLMEAAKDVPEPARPAVDLLVGQLRDLEARIEAATARIKVAQRSNALARRLATIPGLGPIASSAFAATTPDVTAFRSARDYAAWLGLTPRAHSSGGKERLGRISKAGNRYLRRLLYLGAMMSHRVAMRSRPMANDQRAAGAAHGPARPSPRLAGPDAGAQAGEGRGRCARRAYGQDSLGADRPRGQLPGHPGLRKEIAAGPVRRPRNGEAQREVMAQKRRQDERDTQFGPERPRARAIDRDPFSPADFIRARGTTRRR